MGKRLAGLFAVLFALFFVYGCSRTASKKLNMVENADFTAWAENTQLPAGWKVEGSGLTVKKSTARVEGTNAATVECAFSPDSAAINAPFVYWQASDPKKFWGKSISAGVWVKTSTANAVAVELSNRGGVDFKSGMQAGNGQWQFLNVSWKVPENTSTVELRVRFYGPATAYFGNPTITDEGII